MERRGGCKVLSASFHTVWSSIMEHPGPDPPNDRFRSQLSNRLLDARMIVVNEPITSEAAGRIAEQLTVLDSASAEPIRLMMSHVPGGDVEAGLSTYDLIRSLTAPVTVLASGRIAGAGVLAFVGVPSERRFALPHARCRFEEVRETLDEGSAADLETGAQSAARRRERIVALLAETTGQAADQVAQDLSAQRSFEAEEAVEYGLVGRVVESRREIE